MTQVWHPWNRAVPLVQRERGARGVRRSGVRGLSAHQIGAVERGPMRGPLRPYEGMICWLCSFTRCSHVQMSLIQIRDSSGLLISWLSSHLGSAISLHSISSQYYCLPSCTVQDSTVRYRMRDFQYTIYGTYCTTTWFVRRNGERETKWEWAQTNTLLHIAISGHVFVA